jgi:D-alanyl-lipoteichoic acid acyltransferase DltB (MBOAT superfamily)
MLFHSLDYLLFLPVALLVYLTLPHRLQNLWLLGASLWFYAAGTGAVLWLLALVAFSAWLGALKGWAWLGIGVPLLALGWCKYCNFFTDTVSAGLSLFGARLNLSLDLLLPLGVSFFTFQAVGYVIEVRRGRVAAVRDPIDCGLFLTFFPQLVSGPIGRATTLLPQVLQPRRPTVEGFHAGLWLVLLGLWKKLCVADPLGAMAEPFFASADRWRYLGGEVALAGLLFSLQIYADFAGYTDVARGSARMFGFELQPNFRAPYLARNIQEFWNRWHISLSTWIRDYVYYPLALTPRIANRLGAGGLVLVTMAAMGLWHGPSWRFVLWGCYHGALLWAYGRLRPFLFRHVRIEGPLLRAVWITACIACTFVLCSAGGVLFRAQTTMQGLRMLRDVAWNPVAGPDTWALLGQALALYWLVFVLDLLEEDHAAHEPWRRWPSWLRLPLQVVVCLGLLDFVLNHTDYQPTSFLYFRF